MGADIKQLRTRIKSVDSTLHLTKAMGLVASSKIRRATESMHKGVEYSDALSETVNTLSTYAECKKSLYMKKHSGDRICLIVIAGDRGLAGGYNANIFRLMREYPDATVIPIGKRACERYGKEIVYAENFSYDEAKSIADDICRDFTEEKFDRFGIVCTKYHSLMSQEAYVKWLLPLEESSDASATSAVFEPDEITREEEVFAGELEKLLTDDGKWAMYQKKAVKRAADFGMEAYVAEIEKLIQVDAH